MQEAMRAARRDFPKRNSRDLFCANHAVHYHPAGGTGTICVVNLNTLIGYHKDDYKYNFLDDYEVKKWQKQKVRKFGPDEILL